MAEGTTKKIYFAQETNPSLPVEVVTEILSWLPVHSLIVSKCVCREWKSIIEDPKFIKNHIDRASPEVFLEEQEDVDDKQFKVIRASEGLVLEEAELFNYRIKNLATRQVLRLPDPVKEPGYMFFSYVFGSNVYKLVHVHSKGEGSRDLDCEVLTIADDLAWRGLEIPKLENMHGTNPYMTFSVISDVCYIIKIGGTGLADCQIIWIDLVTECSSCVKIPNKFGWDRNNVNPLMWKEKLSLTTVVGHKLIIWVLENHMTNQWAEEIVIPLTFMKDSFIAVDKVRPSHLYGNILSIDVNDDMRIGYDIEAKVVIDAVPLYIAQNSWLKLQPSLVQVQGMQVEERIEG